jgi:phosphoribosylglycinamide formyltransferase, formyltetrahydrofolate-dependent
MGRAAGSEVERPIHRPAGEHSSQLATTQQRRACSLAFPCAADVLTCLADEVASAFFCRAAGPTLRPLADSIAAGRIPGAEIAIVVSNREGAPGVERARQRGIPVQVIPSKGLEREAYDRQVAAVLEEARVDLVCLAGYMRLLSPYFVNKFNGRILNIHPSLLPAFPGLEAQRQALEHGVKFSGCTVHFVDENLDAGAIVAQAVVEVRDDDTPDTLAARILAEEHKLYTQAVRIVLEGNYRIEGRRVIRTKN